VVLLILWVFVPGGAIAQNDAVEKAIGALKAGDPAKRMLAARQLCEFLDPRGVNALNAAIGADPDPLVRGEIADCLWHIVAGTRTDDERHLWVSIPALVAALGDPDAVVRSEAEDALRWSGPAVIGALVPLLDSENKDARRAAASLVNSAASEISEKFMVTQAMAGGFKRLSQDLDDPDARYRCTASFCLGFGYYSVDPPLKNAARAVKRAACAEAERWLAAERANTSAAYQQFATKYPRGLLAEEARRRAGDPAYALLVTFQMGKYGAQKRMEGYLKSHARSPYAAFTHEFLEFLQAAEKSHGRAALQQCISAHPDSPVAVAARLSSPLLMLKDSKGTVGVTISVGHLQKKGLLGGGLGSEEKAKQTLWSKLSQQLSAEGIPAALLEGPAASLPQGAPQYQLIVEYSEAPPAARAYPGGPDSATGLHAQAVANLTGLLAGILRPSVEVHQWMRLIDARDDSCLFPSFRDLDSTLSLFDVVPLLARNPADKRAALMRLLLTLPHVDLRDPQQRDAAKSTLVSLMGQ
jgi:hypothetical protein